jgi:hypothetical protein
MNFGLFTVAIEILCIYSFNHALKCPRSFLVINLSIDFPCENWTVQFGKLDDSFFSIELLYLSF